MTKKKGLYIAIEGIDGCGKSSLVKALSTRMQEHGASVVITKEPGGTHLGTTLRTLVQAQKKTLCDKSEFLIFAADRAQHIATVVTPALTQGNVVISDRCFISSIAYQGFGRGLDLSVIDKVNSWATDGCKPDIIIYLALDAQTAHDRLEQRNTTLTAFEQEKNIFWNNVIKGFQHCCSLYKNMVSIDASRCPEVICDEVTTLVLRAYQQK